MGKSRRQNTKAERSDRESIQELKGIIKKKDKEIGQLRKELSRRRDLSDDFSELVNELKELDFNPPVAEQTNCPKCRKKAETIEVGKFTILVCSQCHWRTRKK